MQQDGLGRTAHAKIPRMIHFAGQPRTSCYTIQSTNATYQTGFHPIENYCKVSTPFEGLGDGPFRGWKNDKPRPRSSFSQEEMIGEYGTRIIDRNNLNHIDNN